MIGGFAKSTFAAPAPLEVTFSPNPLFKEVNFAPGNQTTGIVEVSNNSGSSQNIIVEATNISVDTSGFGDKLKLVITEDGVLTPRYTGTLGKFLSNDGEVLLSSLSSGTNTTYSFGVTFDSGDDDNDLQNKKLGFDLCVGFQGGATQCGLTVISGENGGGGAGISGSMTLIISNEQALNITNVNNSSSTIISWSTNKLATSQVIYGPVPGPYNLDLTVLPNFGYPYGKTEDGNKVMNHSVTLSGLTPGQTYVYRVVSRASPATVSYEHEFTVPLLAQRDNNNNNNTVLNNNRQVLGAPNDQSGIGEPNTDENIEDLNNNEGNLLAASAGNIMGLPTVWFWALLVILLLLIILIIRIIYRRRKNKKVQ